MRLFYLFLSFFVCRALYCTENFRALASYVTLLQEIHMNDRHAEKIRRAYNVAYWGNDYFYINDLGHICVRPNPEVSQSSIDLAELLKEKEGKNSQPLPALFFFPQILQHRLHAINKAFKSARDSFGYQGDYCLVYPIKVNQHRRVIESLLKSGESLGLEAGSKAEMVAVLAYAGGTRSLIVCNGYKDREYIRLALMG